MKKAIIIFPFFLLILNGCFSQFQMTNSNSDYFLATCEYLNGKTVIIGTVFDENLQKYIGKATMLDQQGNIILQRTYVENDGNLIFANIIYKQDRFYVFSIHSSQTVNKLALYQLDTIFNIIDTTNYITPLNENIAFINTIIDSDNSFVVTGYSQGPNNRMFLFKINQAGDSILLKYSNQLGQFAYKIHESVDHLKYYIFIDGFYNQFGYGGILQLNKSFDTLEHHYINLPITKVYSSIPYQDSLFLVLGSYYLDNNILKLLKINLYGNILQSNFYFKEIGMKETPSILPGIAISGSDYYLGSTSNMDYSNPNYSSNDSWFHLIKVNQNLETIWEKWYGGDAYYILRSNIATSDGGCLMVGTKYPHGIENEIIQSHYVKVDANGDVQWTQDIEMPELSYKVYPNPTQSVFNIENGELNIKSIELYDISGRYLKSIEDCFNSTISIDLSSFSNGIYFAKVKSSKGVRTEKVVKN